MQHIVRQEHHKSCNTTNVPTILLVITDVWNWLMVYPCCYTHEQSFLNGFDISETWISYNKEIFIHKDENCNFCVLSNRSSCNKHQHTSYGMHAVPVAWNLFRRSTVCFPENYCNLDDSSEKIIKNEVFFEFFRYHVLSCQLHYCIMIMTIIIAYHPSAKEQFFLKSMYVFLCTLAFSCLLFIQSFSSCHLISNVIDTHTNFA